jgi:hypothetical protein
MGSINVIKETFPTFIKEAISSYFYPLLLSISFLRGLFKKGSSSKIVFEYVLKKIRSALEGHRWPEIDENLDAFASDTNQMLALRKVKINWIASSENKKYDLFFKMISKESRSFESMVHKVYLKNILDLEGEIESSRKDLTYNIILIDEVHRTIAESNLEAYERIINSINVLPVFTAMSATTQFKELIMFNEYINLDGESSKSKFMIAAKALELKIEEFMSKVEGLTSESTGSQ